MQYNKIAVAYDQKIPYVIVIGNKEKEARVVMLKNLRENEQQLIKLDEMLSHI